MVEPAAGAHRVLLQQPPSGGGLPGVENLRAEPVRGLDVLAREARDSTQPLKKVERRALGRKDRTERPFDGGEDRAASGRGAVGNCGGEGELRAYRAAHQLRNR